MKKVKNIRIIDPGTSPDVDTDFNTKGRNETLNYVIEKYGIDKVSSIITPGPFKTKTAFRDVASAFNIPFSLANKLGKMLPEMDGTTLKDIFNPESKVYSQYTDFRNAIDTPELEKVIEVAKEIENRMKATGQHACGILISNYPLTDVIPVQNREQDNMPISQWNYYTTESLGLLKMDFLGLQTIDIITDTINLIKDTTGTKVDVDEIIQGPLDDKKTYELFSQARTDGIFQFSSAGVKEMLRKLKPTEFIDLATVTALYRPGPMGMNAHNEFADRKNNKELRIPAGEKSFYGTKVEDILKETYGIVAFQEQVMKLAKECSDFTSREADDLRKAIGKKNAVLMESLGDKFKNGMIKKGYNKQSVENLWDGIVAFGAYAFNKSHSVSYALNAYISGYLKANYPVHFMTALIKNNFKNKDKMLPIFSEIKKMNITLLPADVNYSQKDVSINNKNQIVFGVDNIKNFSNSLAENILREREDNGEYKDVLDFVSRMSNKGLTIKTFSILAQVGAFDSFGIPRKELVEKADVIFKRVTADNKIKSNTFSLFSFEEVNEGSENIKYDYNNEYDFVTFTKYEADFIGDFLTSHPLEKINTQEQQLEDFVGETYVTVSDYTEKKTKNGHRFAVITLNNRFSSHEYILNDELFLSITKDNLYKKYVDPVLEEIRKNPEKRNELQEKIKDSLAKAMNGFNENKIETIKRVERVSLPEINKPYKVNIYKNNQDRRFINKLEPLLLDKDGNHVLIFDEKTLKYNINVNKKDTIIKKLKEYNGQGTVRIVFSDKTSVDVSNVDVRLSGSILIDLIEIVKEK